MTNNRLEGLQKTFNGAEKIAGASALYMILPPLYLTERFFVAGIKGDWPLPEKERCYHGVHEVAQKILRKGKNEVQEGFRLTFSKG